MKRLFGYNPNLSQSWVLLGLVFAAQIFASSVALIIQHFNTNAQSLAMLCSYILTFVIMGFIVIRLGKEQQRVEDIVLQGIKVRFPLCILLLFFMPLLSIVIEPLYMWIPMPEFMENVFSSAFTPNLFTFISVVIAAPFAEEWLCRGVILKGLLTNNIAPYKAIAWSALIFAIMHLNPWQAIPAFFLGFAIGWVYWRTKSLWPCIFMHAVNNGFSFLLLAFFPDVPTNASLYDVAGPHYLFIYTGAVIFSIAFGYGVWRMTKNARKAGLPSFNTL